MSTDSPTSTMSAGTIKFPAATTNAHTSQTPETSCQQVALSQCKASLAHRDSSPYSFTPASVDRRHSVDGSPTGLDRSPPGSAGQGQGSSGERFHPYRRQHSDNGVTSVGRQVYDLPEPNPLHSFPTPNAGSGEELPSWDSYSDPFQATRLLACRNTFREPPAAPEEPSCFLSQNHTSYSPLATLQQPNSFQYSLQCLSSPSPQDSATLSLFPKPIYSYSILIFMALKNSTTGSLPVSEIYSFMTDNFPYFKTAPDGWKNSVRHNLSLNKCFEKVENKSGNSSRKGCLWALNPAKVEKMQEELHKWRRKDPMTVRKSMARPEDFDRLLGAKPEKLKALFHSQTSQSSQQFDSNHRSFTPAQLGDPCPPYPHVPAPSLNQHYLPPTPHHLHPHPYAIYSSCGQQAPIGVQTNGASLDSPPAYSAALLAEYGLGPRSMQELLLEAEASSDIDTLNPTLTDLQLHGNLWEELREEARHLIH